MEIKDVNAFIQQWKINHHIYGELTDITEEMEQEWLKYFFSNPTYSYQESELEGYADYIAGAGSGRYYDFISASTKITKAAQATRVVPNTTPISYDLSTNKWSYKTQTYCLDPVDKIVNVANLFSIDDVYYYLKTADANDDPEDRISKLLLGSAMAATYAIIPLSFSLKLSADFLKLDKLTFTGIKDVFTKFFTKIDNLESPIVTRFPLPSDDVYTAPTVLTQKQKIGTALGNHYAKVLKAYSLLVMDPLWMASSIYDYQKAQNGDGVTAKEKASLASSVLFLGSDVVSITGMVADSLKAVGTAAKALKVAGTVCSVIGTILEAGAYVALAVTKFTSLDSDSSSEEIALTVADPALQLGLMASGLATFGIGTVLSMINISAIANAVKLDEARKKATNDIEKKILNRLYEIAVLDAIPVVGWFSGVYTDKMKSDLKDEMITKYGSIDNMLKELFEARHLADISKYAWDLKNNTGAYYVTTVSAAQPGQIVEQGLDTGLNESIYNLKYTLDGYFSNFLVEQTKAEIERTNWYGDYNYHLKAPTVYLGYGKGRDRIDTATTFYYNRDQLRAYAEKEKHYRDQFINQEVEKYTKAYINKGYTYGGFEPRYFRGYLENRINKAAYLDFIDDTSQYNRNPNLGDEYYNDINNYIILTLSDVFYSRFDLRGGNDVLEFSGIERINGQSTSESENNPVFSESIINVYADGGDGNDMVNLTDLTEFRNQRFTTIYHGEQSYGEKNVIEVSDRSYGIPNGEYEHRYNIKLKNFEAIILASKDGAENYFCASGASSLQGERDQAKLREVNLFGGSSKRNEINAKDVTDFKLVYTASHYENIVNGTENNDVIKGKTYSIGDSMYDHSYHGNTFYGHGGDDLMSGGAFNDYLDGGDGNDVIDSGGLGRDIIIGGNGDDTITDYESTDYVDGGEGIDKISYKKSDSGVTVDLYNETVRFKSSGRMHRIYNVENIEGSQYDDEISGFEDLTNIVTGGDGNDIIRGGYEGDYFEGQNGNDSIYGYSGEDIILGNNGNDLIYGGAGEDILIGGSGYDIIYGGDDNDTIIGGTPLGYEAYYYEGNELHGGGGTDFIYGDKGNDIIYGDEGNDQLDGGEGDDTLYGGEGDDVFVDVSGRNNIYGGSGNDYIKGKMGVEHALIDGGDGLDILDYSDSEHNIDANLSSGSISFVDRTTVYSPYYNRYIDSTIVHESDWLTLNSVEGFIGGDHNDNIIGSSLDNYLEGGLGNDTISGMIGNDTILGGKGSDTLTGNSGNDIIYGEDGDDILSGGSGSNKLFGGSGSNTYEYTINSMDGAYSNSSSTEVYSQSGTDMIKLVELDIYNIGSIRRDGDDLIINIQNDQNCFIIKGWYLSDHTKVGIQDVSGTTITKNQLDILAREAMNFEDTRGTSFGQAMHYYNNYIKYGYGYCLSENQKSDGQEAFNLIGKAVSGQLSSNLTIVSQQTSGTTTVDNTISSDVNGQSTPTVTDTIANTVNEPSVSSNDYNCAATISSGNYYLSDSIITTSSYYDYYNNNSIYGDSNNNFIYGGDSNDYINGIGGNNILVGGSGDDKIVASNQGAYLPNNRGSNLYGGIGNDTLIGSDGNDIFIGGSGNDDLLGYGGNDTFSFSLDSSNHNYKGSEYYDNGEFGHDSVSSSGHGTLFLEDFKVDQFSFERINGDLVLNVINHDSSISINSYYYSVDKPDFDIVFNNTDGQSYTYNLAGLITQIAAFEDSNNVTWESIMKKSRTEASNSGQYDLRLAAESILGYQY